MALPKSNGLVFYRGPSQLDGKPIVAIITGVKRHSDNIKTGDLLQTWILPQSPFPTQARKDGTISSVCGNCKYQKFKMCYVNTKCGVGGVFKCWKSKGYPVLNKKNIKLLHRHNLRIGSFGDPTSIPMKSWQPVLSACKSSVGYTHQWSTCDQRFKNICMASVDNRKEYFQAKQKGWRTFRVRLPGEVVLKSEMICPASNHKTTCEKCLSCCGLKQAKRKSVVIVVHGEKWKIRNFRRFRKVKLEV